VVLTRTSAAVRSQTLKNVQEQLVENGIEVLRTGIVERAAFRDLFDFGGTLSDLDAAQVRNLGKAIENADEFAGEVITKLRQAEADQPGETT
jgi:chromosome partitioning protein